MSLRKNSRNARLVELEVGERFYVECTLETYATTMRTANTPRTRRPAELQGREFTASLFTAVSNSKAGDIRYLVCIERTE